jgi:microcystin-dependent protein
MSDPFLSEIRIMAFNFPPKGWALCNGQLLPINQNQALFSLLGTVYGGNGQTNFALPNLQGKVPLHMGPGFQLGQTAGQYAHTVTQSEMPTHFHPAFGSNVATAGFDDPLNRFVGGGNNLYHAPTNNLTTLRPEMITNTGGSQPHENKQPYLVLNFCIALSGIFPSQT